MKNISKNEALEIIEGLGVSYIMEADSLRYLISENKNVECIIEEGLIIVIHYSESSEYVSLLPTSQEFDIQVVFKIINAKCKKPNILVNIQKLSDSFSKKLNRDLRDKYAYIRRITDYVYEDHIELTSSSNIRLLNEKDRDCFINCTNEALENRPPLPLLFEMFVEKKQGKILAFFEGNKVVGYLSFYLISNVMYDVDYIYVVPEKRGQGIAKKLTSAYALYAKRFQHAAYWSNAKNKASVNTAVRCGFKKNRVVEKYASR